MSNIVNKVLAIVPARGGSKGIHRKNLTELAGLPLLVYSIRAAQGSAVVSDVVVTSDDDEILTAAARYDVGVIHRPEELACDEAAMDPVIGHALDEMEKRGSEYQFVVLLQPTSPLRTAEDIDAAFDLIKQGDRESVISVYESPVHPYHALFMSNEGCLQAVIEPEEPVVCRQDLPRVYYPNGAIYMFTVEAFRREGRIPRRGVLAYVMEPERSIDVDTVDDLERVRAILEGV